MGGWEASKLNDPAKGKSIKYEFGRFIQDQGYDPVWARTHLSDISNAFNAKMGRNVTGTVAGKDDMLNFQGEGWSGPIDVLKSDNSWQWLGGGAPPAAAGGAVRPSAPLPGLMKPGGGQLFNPEGQAGGGGGPSMGFGNDLLDRSYAKLIQSMNQPTEMGAQRFEAIRAPIEKARRTQLNQARAELASRGLLSEPGHPQGPEAGAMQRIEERIAPEFATAVQNAATEDEFNRRQTLQGALSGGTQRQMGLAQVALENLSQNRQWNQFLAQFGMDQQRVAAEIERGNTQNLVPLLDLFMRNMNQGGETSQTQETEYA